MSTTEHIDQDAIAEQAGEWLATYDDGPLDAKDTASLRAWLESSPSHVEKFLAVSAVARDLKLARTDPEFSVEAILARTGAAGPPADISRWARIVDSLRGRRTRPWVPAALVMAGIAALAVGVPVAWNAVHPLFGSEVITALNYQTKHGEQMTQRLSDGSVLHLNTDSAVSIRYGKRERRVTLLAGEMNVEVKHEAHREFRVRAGSAEVIDLGTRFDVRLQQGATLVTVVEGKVAVGLSDTSGPPRFVALKADQQIRVTTAMLPAMPISVDAARVTAWMQRQIVFNDEPLEQVVAELNRYWVKPVEIEAPDLRSMRISGVFATDDPQVFIAFIRTLKGVRVEEGAARIRVSGN